MNTLLLLSVVLALLLGALAAHLFTRNRYESKLQILSAEKQTLAAEKQKLDTELQLERAQLAQKLASIEESREQILESFNSLSKKAFEANSEYFLQ